MEQKEKQEKQETRQPYVAPWCERIELEVEDSVLVSGSDQDFPDSAQFLRGGRD